MKYFLSAFLAFSLQTVFASDINSELIVKLKPGHVLPHFQNVKSVQNLFGNIYILRGSHLENIKAMLLNQSMVEYVENNHRAEKSKLPMPFSKSEISTDKVPTGPQFNDPQVGKIWSFQDAATNGVSVNSAYKEYGTSNTNSVIVAVVDTGVDYTHEDIKDIMWMNQGEIAGNGIDDDGNGYIDDIYGINTLVRDSQGKATVNIKDTHSHGTHVSGTIAAKQNNGVGIAGIASNVKIMALRTVPNDGDETDVDVAEAFIYAAKNGAKIINCSFGKSNNEGKKLIPDTLKYIADNYGVLVIAAAGNESTDIDKTPSYPASFNNDNLLIIASTSSSGSMSYFSNYGKINVDVAAPGSEIFSTVPGNKYQYMSGTSMATPTTVGVAAEILAHHPELSYKGLKEVLMNSVTKIESFKSKMVSGGRIDLLRGLELARSK